MGHNTSVAAHGRTGQSKKNSTSALNCGRIKMKGPGLYAWEESINDNSFPLWQKKVILLFASVNY